MAELNHTIPAPDSAKKQVEDLIEKFSRNLDSYKNPAYKEDQCRIEFINPFFESLGWDIANKQGFAEQYKEVIHEDTLNLAGLTKAPDYSFRIGGARKFFLEAKKPATNLKTDASPAYQLRRYAWSAKLPLSILTDFEEFAVYDCRIRPDEKDKADAARVSYLTFDQYLDQLNRIYSVFSKEAVLKGSFDRFIESARGKRGTSEVDSEFLKEIERWREILAKNIALRNPKLKIHQLNDAVQRTIDRIVFLRMAEDRGIESYQQLLAVTNGTNIYKRLCEVFYRAEDKYNSGLFDFKKDTSTTGLKIDDKVLVDIVSDLYYPKCPYEFSVLGADILGNIYEQFLGKVIRLTPSHQAKVEEKPEVKKAGGVYYTPKYIVDYIVKNTLGRLIEADKSVCSPESADTPERGAGTPACDHTLNSTKFTRRRLPHLQVPGKTYFVTFNSKRGPLPEHALRLIVETIKHDEGKKYELDLAVVMPDHVHMIIQPLEKQRGQFFDLSETLKMIKGVSAHKINRLLGAKGQLWWDESFDTIINSEEEYQAKLDYIYKNPVKAGIVKEPEQYKYFVRAEVRDKSVPPTLTPNQISKVKILDPACGSGSFLLGAYQYLLDHHQKWYSEHYSELGKKTAEAVYQGAKGQWLLTTREKKRILLSNIFGVDIDPQAVEVTKLSLLLKVLEGESEETINKQLKLFKERALPDLDSNIKCGNSLIGTDFYQKQQASFFDDEQKYKINAFDWETEFKEIFARGTDTPASGTDTPVGDSNKLTGKSASAPGFGIIVGNPPYIFGEYHDENTKQYLESNYSLAKDQYDTYALFIERALKLANRKGRVSMIVPDALLARDLAQDVRKMLLTAGLERIYHCGLVFEAAVSACVFTVTKGEQPERIISEIREDSNAKIEHACAARRFRIDEKNKFLIHASDEEAEIIEKLQDAGIELKGLASISRGEEIGKKHVFDKGPTPILVGDDIDRYFIRRPSRFIKAIEKNKELYRSPKIVIVKTGTGCIASLDMSNFVTMQSVYNLRITAQDIDPKAILSILNSKLVKFFIEKTFTSYKLLFPQLNQTTIESISIPEDIKAKQQPLVVLVDLMLSLHKKLSSAKTPDEKTRIEREIRATDSQIDKLVYQLYGLTEEEIEIVEGDN